MRKGGKKSHSVSFFQRGRQAGRVAKSSTRKVGFAKTHKELKTKRSKAKPKKKAIVHRLTVKKTKRKVAPKAVTKKIAKEKSAVKEKKADKDQAEGQILEMKVEKEKRFIMWSGITFFMILILVFWVYNTRQVMRNISQEADNETILDWQELGADVSTRLEQMRSDLDQIKALRTDSTSTPTATLPINEDVNTGPSTSSGLDLSEEELKILKEKLEQDNN